MIILRRALFDVNTVNKRVILEPEAFDSKLNKKVYLDNASLDFEICYYR
jgi:hypothetical protein